MAFDGFAADPGLNAKPAAGYAGRAESPEHCA